MQMTLARKRTTVRLNQKLTSGGEGTIYLIDGYKDHVAKIYKNPPDLGKAQKLLTMAESANPALLRVAAWPIDVLLNRNEAAQGFIMPRIHAREDIHELYSPKSRSESFSEANFSFLVHVAANIARAFGVVHEQGYVVGDINHGNILVGADGKVVLIDCDSFQVRNGASTFTCDVGVPIFTPPELQGQAFRGLQRTANHDRFGLAVLIFHLLFMGRHPFAGRYLGRGEMPIERAIQEYRFAYGLDHATHQMERPPGTIPLESMGPTIAGLFVAAFGRKGSNGGRPESRRWISALEALKANLRTCSKAAWHQYPSASAKCPWCAVEVQTGIRLFGHRLEKIDGTPSGTINVGALWHAITAVPKPGNDPTLPSERPWSLPPGVDIPSSTVKFIRKALGIGLVCAGLVACNGMPKDGGLVISLVSYGFAFATWPRISADKRNKADKAYAEARTEWNAALAKWRREAVSAAFDERLEALKKACDEVSDLPEERRRRLAKLERERKARQLERYLDRFRIDRAKIKGIATSRTATLASYGIETAADVDRRKIMRISGFGEALTSELIDWRQRHERNFRFNPNEPLNPKDIATIDHELEARRRSLLETLTQGPASLQRLRQNVIASRARLMPVLEKAWSALKIAEAQRKAL